MKINFANFVSNIPYMLKGMLGLFIALGAIALSIIILNKISDKQ
ncbi:MAG: oxaloacetate decarboxylase [Firmicutes bacterium]|nr:oxaloacetate decarboxylase [Candidatus Colivicinus equi]